MWATGRTSPVIDWLRALAGHEHERCGGPGVGAIGMCFTGGFALAMATHPSLLAPVLSQPSLPLAITPQAAAVDRLLAGRPRRSSRQRCAADGLQVLGLRFKGDRFVPARALRVPARAARRRLRRRRARRRRGQPRRADEPHSVRHRAPHRRARPADPAALDQVLDLFRTRLLAGVNSDFSSVFQRAIRGPPFLRRTRPTSGLRSSFGSPLPWITTRPRSIDTSITGS